MSDISLELPGGIKILSAVPSDPRTRTVSLDSIENDATYMVGFSPIYNEEDETTYYISEGSASTGWVFEKLGSGGVSSKNNTPINYDGSRFTVNLPENSNDRLIIPDGTTSVLLGFSLPESGDDSAYTASVLIDNVNNSSAIFVIDYEGSIYWTDGDPQNGVPANGRLTITFTNISETEVDGYTF